MPVVSMPPLIAEDLTRFCWIDHVRLSPSGDRVAYEVSWADAEARQNTGRVMVASLEPGAPARELRADVRRDRAPEGSPDGSRIAFLGRQDARDQLFVAPADGAQAAQLTAGPDGVLAAAWSPDGASLAYLARVVGDPAGVGDDPPPPEGGDPPTRPPGPRVALR